VRYVAPIDADFQGTWIAVNEYGLSIALLNGAASTRPSALRRSRGMVIRDLVRTRCIDDCEFLLRRMRLSRYAPFTLVLLAPDAPAMVAEWDDGALAIDSSGDSRMPVTSSSFDPEGVRRSRAAEFEVRARLAGKVDPSLLYRFHSSHSPSRDAYSVCMHREDAQTVSFSWIVVTPAEVRFLYSAAALCSGAPGEQQILARRAWHSEPIS
jgi:hypothetical protein